MTRIETEIKVDKVFQNLLKELKKEGFNLEGKLKLTKNNKPIHEFNFVSRQIIKTGEN